MRRVKKLSEAWYRTNSGCLRSVSNTIVKETLVYGGVPKSSQRYTKRTEQTHPNPDLERGVTGPGRRNNERVSSVLHEGVQSKASSDPI